MRNFYYTRIANIECNKIGRRHAEGLHNEENNDLYCSPNIIRVTKSRRTRWAGHVAHVEERCMQGFCGET